jgi:hypothetical protein
VESRELGLNHENGQDGRGPAGPALRFGFPLEGSDQPSDPGGPTAAKHLAEEESGGDSGSETEQRPGPERGAAFAPKTPCDRQLHAVNLIPRMRPENRDRTMSERDRSTGRPPIGRLLLLALVVLTGLVLFFVMERTTPAVVTPAGGEEIH